MGACSSEPAQRYTESDVVEWERRLDRVAAKLPRPSSEGLYVHSVVRLHGSQGVFHWQWLPPSNWLQRDRGEQMKGEEYTDDLQSIARSGILELVRLGLAKPPEGSTPSRAARQQECEARHSAAERRCNELTASYVAAGRCIVWQYHRNGSSEQYQTRKRPLSFGPLHSQAALAWRMEATLLLVVNSRDSSWYPAGIVPAPPPDEPYVPRVPTNGGVAPTERTFIAATPLPPPSHHRPPPCPCRTAHCHPPTHHVHHQQQPAPVFIWEPYNIAKLQGYMGPKTGGFVRMKL